MRRCAARPGQARSGQASLPATPPADPTLPYVNALGRAGARPLRRCTSSGLPQKATAVGIAAQSHARATGPEPPADVDASPTQRYSRARPPPARARRPAFCPRCFFACPCFLFSPLGWWAASGRKEGGAGATGGSRAAGVRSQSGSFCLGRLLLLLLLDGPAFAGRVFWGSLIGTVARGRASVSPRCAAPPERSTRRRTRSLSSSPDRARTRRGRKGGGARAIGGVGR